jgi:DNA-binding MarR family transcriptional regulator
LKDQAILDENVDNEPLAGGQEVDLSQLTRLIGYQLRRAQIAVFDDFIRAFAAHDIRPGQYGVLTAIDCNPGSSQAAIALSLGIKRSNFVKLIDELEQRKLVIRKQVSGDRRANALFLTKTGESGDERAQRVFLEQLQRLTALKAAG